MAMHENGSEGEVLLAPETARMLSFAVPRASFLSGVTFRFCSRRPCLV